MKSVLIITLLVATAIAVPVGEDAQYPYPGYHSDPRVLVRNRGHRLHLPTDMAYIQDPDQSRTQFIDEEGRFYVPTLESDQLVLTKKSSLDPADEVEKPSKSNYRYLYLVGTTVGMKNKRYVYRDAKDHLFIKW